MIRVMVVDDSPLVRKIASDILNGDPEITVIATAARAEFALSKLERERPDVITMDIEMPGMGGLAAIAEIMRTRPTPVIVLSAHAREGAVQTLTALEAGAVEFVLKPVASLSGGLEAVARELVEKVKTAAGVRLKGPGSPSLEEAPFRETAPLEPLRFERGRRAGGGGRFELVAIGTSTGGPVALKTLLESLPERFPVPIVVVQHMPPVFTKAFAERLNSCCAVQVKEAEEADALRPGRVLIAPGDWHLAVSRFAAEPRVSLHQKPAVSGHRPSVDVLMHSVAREYGNKAIAVIMTGMGKDGAEGLHELKRRGGAVIAQDRDSSVIFGMNREVIVAGDADRVLPLEAIGRALMEQLNCIGEGGVRHGAC